MSALNLSDDEASPRVALRRAIRTVERQRNGGMVVAFLVLGAVSWPGAPLPKSRRWGR